MGIDTTYPGKGDEISVMYGSAVAPANAAMLHEEGASCGGQTGHAFSLDRQIEDLRAKLRKVEEAKKAGETRARERKQRAIVALTGETLSPICDRC